MSFLGNALFRAARQEHFMPIVSNFAGALKSFGAVKPACMGFVFPAAISRPFQTATTAGGASFVRTNPMSTLLARFKLSSNNLHGSHSHQKQWNPFEWSFQSKISVAGQFDAFQN
jgi:hypothetical protein